MNKTSLASLREDSIRLWKASGITNLPVALLDLPTHMNVGDSMIWAGEETYLAQLGCEVRYRADLFRYDRQSLEFHHPEGPILLHGGGNFGDIWPLFQDFRERVLEDFPDRLVIQLPQTIHFESRERAQQANAAMGKHPNFLLMVRDQVSIGKVRDLLPDVSHIYVPDSALGWQPEHNADDARGLLLLARQDRESTGELVNATHRFASSFDVTTHDWGLKRQQWLSWKICRIPGQAAKVMPILKRNPLSVRALNFGYMQMLQLNLSAGVSIVEKHRLVVTDRLHAHVLAGLLDIPHIVLDNSYGKVASIYNDYTHALGQSWFAESIDEASEIAFELAKNNEA